MSARTAYELATALRGAGRHAEAAPLYQHALTSARARQSTTDQLRVLDTLTTFHEELGDPDTAEAYRTEATRLRSGG